MFKNNKKEIFSIRKFKNGRSDSVKVGSTLLNSGATMFATEINGNQLPEVVSNTDKVPADKSTTFNNSNGEKIFSVDAVLGKDVAEPTKANNNTGEVDGTDTLNIKSEAKVNYILDEDKSKLKDSKTVEAGSGAIKTPYDKKGLAYDTDGKDYRESTIDKSGITLSEETGKEEIIKANGKAYQLQRSEVVDKDKFKYENTMFNDIEAKVSPEALHNKLGEIDYTKIKGKVYLVEETSEGHYGKFVEANNITSDAEAVQAWQNGQATAKDFTKANVTLQEGDTIIVMDKDTYATTDTTLVKNTREGHQFTYEAFSEKSEVSDSDVTSFTYTINRNTYETIKDAGEDGVFGTSDDKDVTVPNGGNRDISSFDTSSREDKLSRILPKRPVLNPSTASTTDVIKDIFGSSYSVIDFLTSKAEKETDKEQIKQVKTNLDNKVNEIIEYMKENKIKVGLYNDEPAFYVSDANSSDDYNKLTSLEDKIKETNVALEGLPLIKKNISSGNATTSDLRNDTNFNYAAYIDEHPILKTVSETYGYNQDEGLIAKRVTSYFRDNGTHTEWDSWKNTTEKVNLGELTSKKGWTIEALENNSKVLLTKSEDNNSYDREETDNYRSTITKKEIITPVRAYKVVSDGTATVNHYYTLKTEPEELKESEERGYIFV